MKIKIHKKLKLWLGILLIISSGCFFGGTSFIIDKYGGPGINLSEANPEASAVYFFLSYAGIGLVVFGGIIAVFGFINRKVYSIKLEGKKLKELGVIRLSSNSLDKDIIIRNILNCGYIQFNNFYYKITKNIAKVLIFEETINKDIIEQLQAIKKDQFFSGAVLLNLGFKENIEKEDLGKLLAANHKLPLQNDLGIYICNGILDNKNNLYIDKNIFVRIINGVVSGFYTRDLLNSIKGINKNKASKSDECVIKEKVEYKLLIFKAKYLALLISSFIGPFCVICGFLALLSNEIGPGIAFLIMGIFFFLVLFIPTLLSKRVVTISKKEIVEKHGFNNKLTIDISKAKWTIRGLCDIGNIRPAIIIFDDYDFEEKELATYKNGKGRYIIIKENEYNVKILNKIIGERTIL